nr:hypothetical protein BaRGS_008732 [Batillaria attramentaria]
MVSGHIFCHLRPPAPAGYSDQALDGDLGISKLLFLKTRAYKKDAGSLVASGPRAHIHIWNVFQGGRLMAQFPGSKVPGGMVSAMVTNKANTLLYTADSLGFIYVWDVARYCLEKREEEAPEGVCAYAGVCVYKLVGANMHVRTFGQPELWDVYNPSTYQHPMVPYDVLVDPMSMPVHPVIAQKESTHEVIHQDARRDGDDKSDQRSTSPPAQYGSKTQFYVSDDQIAAMLKQRPFDKATGKRLRHEKNKKVKVEWSGPSEYQMLHCYDLVDTPQPSPPQLKVNKDDPFDFYID